MMKAFLLLLLGLSSVAALRAQHPFTKLKERTEACQLLRMSEIKPSGWLLEQLREDLDGFVGNLDRLAPDLIVEDDIYGKDRIGRKTTNKDLGNHPEGEDWEVQYLWWNSETQSNWWDGYLRSAFFADSERHKARARQYVDRVLATQDEDGYLGIYQPDLRYDFDVKNGENGELWSKATLYRALLAYYGFTNDERALLAVERAVQNVMDNYPAERAHPFAMEQSYAGLCHGLAFTDVLDQLYQLTGKVAYWDYALFLYQDYSSHEPMEEDVCYANLIDPEYRLKGHGVHTYEHLRSLLVAAFASGNPLLEKALQRYLCRISETTTGIGGAIGDEWIMGRKADPTHTGYEYCSLQELMDAYARLVQKTGDLRYADRLENIFFNAAMGARHPEKSAIAYLKTDNSYEMTGGCNGAYDPQHRQRRYKYSPVHQDVAVCCVPNAGRITPYYVQNMWLKDDEGLVASLFGSCELHTDYGGQAIRIRETTTYPYGHTIAFEVETKQPVSFALKIRKPAWASGCTSDIACEEVEGMLVVRRKWAGKVSFRVTWNVEIQRHRQGDQVFFTYGALALALPIEAVEIAGRKYAEGFQDFEYVPKNLVVYEYVGGMPVGDGQSFTIKLYNPLWQRIEEKRLTHVGRTLLRQATFRERKIDRVNARPSR